MEKNSKKLGKKLIGAAVALLVAIIAVAAATFAWYIYNTGGHTTTLKMAAGSSSSLLISNTRDGEYKFYTSMDPVEDEGVKFTGTLTPVSTDIISNGFQQVESFKDGSSGQAKRVADIFKKAKTNDYYKSRLYLKSTEDNMDVYVQEIGGTDQVESLPVSTAIRVGFVVDPDNAASRKEYIFELTDKKNPKKEYNTDKGYEGCVLDSTKTDGSVVEFTPLTSAAWCKYDEDTGEVTATGAQKICTCVGGGDPVEVDVYIWLEGCDEDCTISLANASMDNVFVKFAGTTGDSK